MKKFARLSILSLFVLAMASPALACHFNAFTPGADCDGWTIDGEVSVSDDPWADVTYLVQLSNGDGLVAEFTDTERFYDGETPFSYGGPWGLDLCGDYDVSIEIHLVSDRYTDDGYFTTSFTCDCPPPPPPPDGCSYTPGYWKNHPDAWPVDGLEVGCVEYTKEELLEIFDMPTRGDATVKLFHHLVAAKLNVLSGGPDVIDDAIMAGDDFLCSYPLGSHPAPPLKYEANDIKDELVGYNEGYHCEDGYEMPMPYFQYEAPATSWGAVKAKY